MRITQNIIANSVIKNIQKNYEIFSLYTKQVSSGKRVSKPSDDPVGVNKSLWLRMSLSRLEQFISNIDSCLDELRLAENALNNVKDSLLRVEEILIASLGVNLTPEIAYSFAQEIDELLNNILGYANTSLVGKSIFSGFQTNVSAFVGLDTSGDGYIDTVVYQGDSGQRRVDVAEGRSIIINTVGSNEFDPSVSAVFRDVNVSTDVFQILIDIRDALFAQDKTALRNQIPLLKDYVSNLSQHLGSIGIKAEEISRLKDNHTQEIILKKTFISEIEEVDIFSAISSMTNQETVYRASLLVGSKLVQLTLFDFLT